MQLADMTIVVSSAASGVGAAVAQRLLNDGAFVVAADRDGTGLEQLDGCKLIRDVVDVSDAAQVHRMIDMALERTGRLDVLINNAGVGLFTFDANGIVKIVDHMPDQF